MGDKIMSDDDKDNLLYDHLKDQFVVCFVVVMTGFFLLEYVIEKQKHKKKMGKTKSEETLLKRS